MENPREGQQEVTSSAYHKQQQKLKVQHSKILSGLREQQIDEKLIVIVARFFKLEDERKGKGLSTQMTKYLEMLTFELDQFIQETHKDSAPKLFRLFMRMNFNKEAVYRYYRDRLDQLLEGKDVDTKFILDRFLHKCSSPVRSDVSYNWEGNQLREDMLTEVETRMLRFRQDSEDFKPLRLNVSTKLIGALIFASFETSLIEKPSIRSEFFKTLSRILRRGDGTPYSPSTFKNAITDVEEMHAIQAKEILLKMDKALDKRIETLKR